MNLSIEFLYILDSLTIFQIGCYYHGLLMKYLENNSLQNYVDAADSLTRTKRDANQYTIEVVVAVDQAMVDKYGDELDDVIMSAMSLASNVYENSNLKHSISISLADIIRLPFDPTEGADSPGTDGGMYSV